MGNTAAAWAGRKKFLEYRNRPLGFSSVHDEHITISEDNKVACWGFTKEHVDGEGRCYSNRTLRENEVVRIAIRGSGFFDLGLTNIHPTQLHTNKEFVFKYIVSKVLYFEPVEMQLRIDEDGSVYFTDGSDPEVKLALDAKASCHWLAMKLGCGEVTVTFLDEDDDLDESSSTSDSDMYEYHGERLDDI